ncbi:MAG: hypothetical protein ACNYVW_00425 [Methanosarcinales archaeon]
MITEAKKDHDMLFRLAHKRATSPRRKLAAHRKYNHEHREEIRIKGREHRAANREKANAQSRAFYQRNKEKIILDAEKGVRKARNIIRKNDRNYFVRKLGRAFMSSYEVHHPWTGNNTCRLLTKEEHLKHRISPPCELIGGVWQEIYS